MRRRDQDSSGWFSAMCVGNLLWAVCAALFYLLPNEAAALVVFDVRFSFVMLSSLCTYLFVFKALKHRTYTRPMLWFLFLFPVATLIIACTNPAHHLLRQYMHMTYENGMRKVEFAYGPWFYVHCAFSYLMLAMAANVMVRQFRRLPRNYKLPVGIMLTGLSLTFLVTLALVLDLMPMAIDPSPIVVQIAQICFYYALYESRSLDMLFTSRDHIFENMRNPVLVMDRDERIMDYNRCAEEVARSANICVLYGTTLADYMGHWMAVANGRPFEGDPSIFTVDENGRDAHYQIQRTDMLNNHQVVIGSYAEFRNITPVMTLVHKLQDSAFYDQLTGLHNRRYFMAALEQHDVPEALPLCVLVGDVNNLKSVNDTYGHAKGDELLQAVAAEATACLPEGALFARIGGDEFAGLVPHTSGEEARRIVAEIDARCQHLCDPHFAAASLSLGYKIKTRPEEDIRALMAQADAEMYATKYDRRKRPPRA